MNDKKNIFSIPENVQEYLVYYSALINAIRAYYDLVKEALENYGKETGVILYFGTVPCGAIAFPKHFLQLMFYRPAEIPITEAEIEKMENEAWYRGALENCENFLRNLPGAKLPQRPAIIEQWLTGT